MDLLQKGKHLAQEGNFEEALDAFLLAFENDKENPDIHFYLGLCYSSLEQFRYAKYHYDIALTLNPNHEKTRLVVDNLKDVIPEKPPERRLTRAAAAKERRQQTKPEKETSEEDLTAHEPEFDDVETDEPIVQTIDQEDDTSRQASEFVSKEQKYKVTDEKWEKAFPTEKMIHSSDEKNPVAGFILIVLAIAAVAALVYFSFDFFTPE